MIEREISRHGDCLKWCKGRSQMKTLPRNSAEDLENFNIMLQRI